jgi:hypothetical protein
MQSIKVSVEALESPARLRGDVANRAVRKRPDDSAAGGDERTTVAEDQNHAVQVLTQSQPGSELHSRIQTPEQAAEIARRAAMDMHKNAGTAVLAHANLTAAGVLALLRR